VKTIAFVLSISFAVIGCGKQQSKKTSATALASQSFLVAPVSGRFSSQELRQFAALDPIDTHTHVYQSTPEFYAMLKRLNLHILDIMLDDDTDPEMINLAKETKDTWNVIHGSDGYVVMCTTFNPYVFNQPDFTQNSIKKINQDFSRGAVAVKFYKNVGMEIKKANGDYLMPDNPVFEPIFKDIEAHNKTLITHLADPNSVFEAPNPAAPDYDYIMQDLSTRSMYKKPGAPSKHAILLARDRILERNPKLRMVGAHLGSMESDFDQLSQHLDRYPNFAVDLAARMPYFERQPRRKMIVFITRYQDRLIYGTDNEFYSVIPETVQDWEKTYANDWRYLATDDILYRHQRVRGLDLPPSILHKIYHDNAVKWFPGILERSR
jgi:predicted TIM-barrel fold metal-dependent hydrolase